ncbi:glycosyltransferase [Enterovibrio norvegicus]|uniref:Glycosyl transferase n=1 Tax=Enterovibrio norvegicus TaxID=188144 RepID=A0A2N7LDY8_9GAMM|nr:glycosyltransferase [Enterovibrio norvegicus]PML75588.1 glycosyl transferase [Enterovibrio norvegicus]PMN93490.1 glycosyl transferase [Enterovibrio norvegicus]
MENVAVIMSVYRSDCLSDLMVAVNSILGQTYKNIHLYLFRDGEVPENIQSYLDTISENDQVYLYQSPSNNGLAKALNKLIDRVVSSKDYAFVARMDSDDISRPARIERQVDFLRRNPDVDVCGTSCKEFGASFALAEKHLPTTHLELLEFSITRCPFIHPTVMFRIRVFDSGIRYPTETAFTEDMALWLELLTQGYKFSNINEILLDYRLNENTIKRRKGLDKAISEVKVRLLHMVKLERISIKSVLLILSRLAFHLLPNSLMRLAYKNAR